MVLQENDLLYKADGLQLIEDNVWVALTLMMAESRPRENDIMVKVVANLIKQDNYGRILQLILSRNRIPLLVRRRSTAFGKRAGVAGTVTRRGIIFSFFAPRTKDVICETGNCEADNGNGEPPFPVVSHRATTPSCDSGYGLKT